MKKLLFFFFMFSTTVMFAQGVTTSAIAGQVTGQAGDALLGVNVTAVHGPTATFYGTTSDENGYYRIDNMRVGGPYTITYSYVGMESVEQKNIVLRLGETYRNNQMLSTSGTLLDEIVVTGESGSVGSNSGSSTQISSDQIEGMPTLNRDIDDFLRLTPQSTGFGGGTSFAGVNNRFNAIYIDGAVNNDVFGLAASGTNGGQTGISPVSIDIIDQLQVVLSPYDVTYGGFAGGGVNAVTKSGSNCMQGTAYYFHRNQNLVGKTNGKLLDRQGLTQNDGSRVAPFSQNLYGLSLGGALVKDKAFFFVNVEAEKNETPAPFDPVIYTGDSDVADLTALQSHLMSTYNYDPGTFGDTSDELDGLKIFAKLDFNLNDNNKLTARHQYTKAEQFNRNAGNSRTINFSNNGVFFPSITNSSAIELNSKFGNSASNNLILGYTRVRDDRDGIGTDFPYVIIGDGAGTIEFGTEPFSSANLLEQDIFTITNNLKLYKGKHTITLGTHNEFYKINNVFLAWNFGQYEFNNLNDFIVGNPADEYQRIYGLVGNATGDNTDSNAEFSAMQLGLYAQDEINISNRFDLTLGLRVDMPRLSDDPAEAPGVNGAYMETLLTAHGFDKDAALAGNAPDGQLMFSPRIGFSYAMDDNRNSVLRGGVGIFTSRIPFVWPGAMYNTNGLTTTFFGDFAISGPINFIPDVNSQYTYQPTATTPTGDLNIFTTDFKYPQVLRGNLAWDKSFAGGWGLTVEGLYTKTLNNVVYTNLNSDPDVSAGSGAFTWTGSGDDRQIFSNSELDPALPTGGLSAVYLASNTSEGYTYNLSTTITKKWSENLFTTLAYAYSDAYAVNEGTSSQNSSQWRGQVHIDGRNNPVYGRSDFAVGHRVLGTVDYRIPWGQNGSSATTFSLFYNGQSGEAFSYVIGSRDARNLNQERGSTSRNRSLFYVPADASDINLVDYVDGSGATVTAAAQYAELEKVINADPSLSNRKGQYAEKNGARAPWQNRFDLGIKQDVGGKVGDRTHRVQFSFDIINFGNLISKSWGTNYNVPGDFNNYFLTTFEGYEADGTTPQFTYQDNKEGNDRFDVSDLASRWQMRVGARYIFGDEDDCMEVVDMGEPELEDDTAALEAEARAKAEAEAAAAKMAAEKAKAEAEAKAKAEAEAAAAKMAAEKAKAEAEARSKAEAEAKAAAEKKAMEVKREVEVKKVFTAALEGINFVTGSSTITQDSYDELDNVVSVMNEYPELKVTINGHTDSTGGAANNKKLSERRANAVLEFLLKKGVDSSRLTAIGWGEESPIASNDTREGRKLNRRVAFEAKYD